MTYQIPKKTKAEVLLAETTSRMYRITPRKILKLQKGILTIFFKGHVGVDFKMKINVYKDANGNNLLLSSTVINNQDIARTGDYYCELRFDFPASNNRLAVGVDHLVEFEIFDGYTYDANNYVALILDAQVNMGFLGSDAVDFQSPGMLGHRLSLFLGEIETTNQEKFFMVKMEGAKLLSNDIVESETISPGYYLHTGTIQTGLWVDTLDSASFILVDGSSSPPQELTRVFEPIVPDPLDLPEGLNTYYYDPDTGEIQFYSTFLLQNSGTVGIMKYYLFLTNFRGRYADPYMSELPYVTYWEPRLEEGLEFQFSQQNNFNGLLSISSSSIVLKNQDKYFNGFFGPNDSFSNRAVTVWRCEGLDNAILEFVGTVRAASLNDDQTTFEIEDILASLDRKFEDELPLTFADLGYTLTNISEEDQLRIVPRLYGKRGPYEVFLTDSGQAIAAGNNGKIWALNTEKLTKLANVSKNDSPSTSNNRTWSIGFGPSVATDLSFDCTAVATITLGAFERNQLSLDTSANGGLPVGNYFAPGDTIQCGGLYGIVVQTDDTSIYVWPKQAYSAANNVIRKKVGAVLIESAGDTYYPLSGRDYSCQIGAGGDLQIVFVNNFEANHSGLGTLDPTEAIVYGRAYNDAVDGTVTEILESIIALTGNIIPAGSFAPPQDPTSPETYVGLFSYPDPILSFTLPFSGDESMPTFQDIIDQILKTAMGFVYFDAAGFMRYKTFLDQSWTDISGNRSSLYIDNQSGIDPEEYEISEKNSTDFTISFDLYDTYAGVEFSYPQNSLQVALGRQFSQTSVAAKKFYNTNKIYQVPVLVDANASYLPDWAEKYAKLVLGRRATFSLTAFTTYGIYLGDDLLVTRDKIVGSEDSSFMRIVSISKGVNDQKLSLLDMKRFPGIL